MINLYVTEQGGSTIQLDLYDKDPILLNLSVEDIYELGKAKGVFSKTFRLPNTPRNETLFKGAFNVNGTTFNATTNIPAYIYNNGVYFTQGNLRLTNIYHNEKLKSNDYEVLFIGDIGDLSSAIGAKSLAELSFIDWNHDLNYANIQQSWLAEKAYSGNCECKMYEAYNSTGVTGSYSWINCTTGATATSIVDPGITEQMCACRNSIFDVVGLTITETESFCNNSDGLLNGDVLYPLVEWGYTYDSDEVPEQSTLSAGFLKSFTDITNPLGQDQLKPAIRIKAIWDKIFSDAGYSYYSDFLNSNRFRSLYYISDITDQPKAFPDNTCDYWVTPHTPKINRLGEDVKFIDGLTKVADPGNNVNESGWYIVPETGTYTFTIAATYYMWSTSATADVYLEWANVGGNPAISHYTYIDVAGQATSGTISYTDTVTLNVGEIYELRMFFLNDPINSHMDCGVGSVKVTAAPDTVNVGKILSNDIKQIDFIKSIIDRFKLVLEPSKDESKKFYIEPWVDWITRGSIKDWTPKWNGEKDIKISPLFYTQKKELIFQDQADTDYPNDVFQRSFKEPYGRLEITDSNDFITGTNEIKGIFAPTPIDTLPASTGGTGGTGITGGNVYNFIFPHLAKDSNIVGLSPYPNEGTREPIEPKPRILFYNGKVGAQVDWYLANDGMTGSVQSFYPLVTPFEQWISGTGTMSTFDINWENEKPIWDPASAFLGRATNTVYTDYWQTWHESYYSPYGRIAEAYFNLTDEDVSKLNFNDKIWVKDSLWYPTKVTDFEIGNGLNTKVTLLKASDENTRFYTYPSGPTGGTTGSSFCSTCTSYKITNVGNNELLYTFYPCGSEYGEGFYVAVGASATICICTNSLNILQGEAVIENLGDCTTPSGCTCCIDLVLTNTGADTVLYDYIDCSSNLGMSSWVDVGGVKTQPSCNGVLTVNQGDVTIKQLAGTCGTAGTSGSSGTAGTGGLSCPNCEQWFIYNDSEAGVINEYHFINCQTGVTEIKFLAQGNDILECLCPGSLKLVYGDFISYRVGPCPE